MKYNFDKITDRENTNCFKFDKREQFFGDKDVLPLWVADMDFEAPDFIKDALTERINHSIFGYTFHSDSFFRSFTAWSKKRYNHRIEPSFIRVAPCVLTGISLAIRSLTNEGDKIIIQEPVYHPFFHIIKDNKRKHIVNNLKEKNGRYEMDLEDLESKIDKDTKMIIICNPHNPVGRVWTREELEKLVAICEKHKLIILSDEIHADIVFKPKEFTPLSSISRYAMNNTVSFMAPSKTFNIAGLSTSLTIIANKEMRKKYSHLSTVLHLDTGNIFGTVALEAAYTHGEAWLEELLQYLRANMEFVKEYLAKYLPKVKFTMPEGTYLLWLDFSALGLTDEELNTALLKKGKVALNKGVIFGKNGSTYMRLNIGSPRAIIEEGLKRIVSSFE
jgi:cystathionine beta-lyase